MATMRRCLRCGHEWSLRAGTEPKTCPKCRSPYWNRQRRDEQMAQMMEMERAVEARRRDEMKMLDRKQMLMHEREMIQSEYLKARTELEALHHTLEELENNPEQKEGAESERQRIHTKAESLKAHLARNEERLTTIEMEIRNRDESDERGRERRIDRDTLLEALDDDAENELYAAGAREYARRLADRVRNGEFDGN